MWNWNWTENPYFHWLLQSRTWRDFTMPKRTLRGCYFKEYKNTVTVSIPFLSQGPVEMARPFETVVILVMWDLAEWPGLCHVCFKIPFYGGRSSNQKYPLRSPWVIDLELKFFMEFFDGIGGYKKFFLWNILHAGKESDTRQKMAVLRLCHW